MKTKTSVPPVDDIDDFTDEQINDAIKVALPERGAFSAYLTRVRLEPIDADTDYRRGCQEGMRLLAEDLQDRARAEKTKLKVKVNKE